MYPETELSKLIGEIYEGVVEPDKWDAALHRFLAMTGGRYAFLGVIDSEAKTLAASSLVSPETSRLDDAMLLHRKEMIGIDPGLPYSIARPEGGNFRFSDTCAELSERPDDWCDFIRYDFGSGDYHSRFGPQRDGLNLVMALHTPADAPRLTAEQETIHAIAFDHLERAARLAYRPPDIGLSPHAVLVVAANCLVVSANETAERLLSCGDGLGARHGTLFASDYEQDKRLKRLVAQTCDPTGLPRAQTGCVIHRRADAAPLYLVLETLPRTELWMRSGAHYCTIAVRDGAGTPAVDPELLRAMFDLTRRQAQIAAMLASSHDDLPAIAAGLGISYETARTHLRAAMHKCGVGSQIELVRLLARLP